MRRLALVLPLILLLAGCTTEQVDRFIGLIDTAETVLKGVNQGIERADTAAKRLCPQLADLGGSAKELACAASASGTPSTRLAKIARYRTAFCDNPSARSAAELASFVAEGIRAARAATAAGCGAP